MYGCAHVLYPSSLVNPAINKNFRKVTRIAKAYFHKITIDVEPGCAITLSNLATAFHNACHLPPESEGNEMLITMKSVMMHFCSKHAVPDTKFSSLLDHFDSPLTTTYTPIHCLLHVYRDVWHVNYLSFMKMYYFYLLFHG